MPDFKLKKPLILASGSPRRRELMDTLGIPFSVLVSDVDESFPSSMAPALVPALLSERKAKAILAIRPDAQILAADTVVVLGGQILNKPVDLAEAEAMLHALSGKTHSVYSAFSVVDSDGLYTTTDRADVTFKSLTNSEIQYYLKNGSPLDKAGGYGIQEWIGLIAVSSIAGSYFTVMGLPVHLVWDVLKTSAYK